MAVKNSASTDQDLAVEPVPPRHSEAVASPYDTPVPVATEPTALYTNDASEVKEYTTDTSVPTYHTNDTSVPTYDTEDTSVPVVPVGYFTDGEFYYTWDGQQYVQCEAVPEMAQLTV